nr:hypothetical protein [uncultured Allomuricauda sp.]
MHLFTISIFTGFILEKYDDEFLEKIAIEIFRQFKHIMDDGYPYEFKYEVYWDKGCVIAHIVVSSDDKDLHNEYFKNKEKFGDDDRDYSKFLKDLIPKLENLPPEVVVNSLKFKLKDYRIARRKTELRGKVIVMKQDMILRPKDRKNLNS